MPMNPSRFAKGPDAPQRPVESVSWYDVVRYCNVHSAKLGLAAVPDRGGVGVRGAGRSRAPLRGRRRPERGGLPA